MKKAALFLISVGLLLTSCATTKIQDGEELVEYKKIDYKVKYKDELTEAELREDCDMLKYLVYNMYAGIDEAIENGFDLDATIEKIYEESLKKKSGLGTISTKEFGTIVRRTFSKDLKNNDQHVYIAGSLRDSIELYYTDVYFEKTEDKFIVKKIQLDANRKADKAAVAALNELKNIQPGMEYTGAESNLYEMLTDDGILYRYGIMTNKQVKTVLLPVNNEKITVPARTEKTIPTKSNWTGLKITDKTAYFSIGDCSQVIGMRNKSSFNNDYWDKYLAEVADAAKGKEQIIFDLRSNPGGYMQYPAKVLSAAYYNQHMDKEFQDNIQALFFNYVSRDCNILVSPFIMQYNKSWYDDKESNYTDDFNRFKPELQEYYKNYWKHMKYRPIRTHVPQDVYATSTDSFPEPDFKGDIYVLINSGSGSAAEFGTQMTYLLQDQGINVHLIGENSWGGMKYGGMCGAELPNSGLYLSVGIYLGEAPSASENPNWHGEGYGWYPDYWATNDTILNTLEQLTGDSQLKDVLNGLDKSQL